MSVRHGAILLAGSLTSSLSLRARPQLFDGTDCPQIVSASTFGFAHRVKVAGEATVCSWSPTRRERVPMWGSPLAGAPEQSALSCVALPTTQPDPGVCDQPDGRRPAARQHGAVGAISSVTDSAAQAAARHQQGGGALVTACSCVVVVHHASSRAVRFSPPASLLSSLSCYQQQRRRPAGGGRTTDLLLVVHRTLMGK